MEAELFYSMANKSTKTTSHLLFWCMWYCTRNICTGCKRKACGVASAWKLNFFSGGHEHVLGELQHKSIISHFSCSGQHFSVFRKIKRNEYVLDDLLRTRYVSSIQAPVRNNTNAYTCTQSDNKVCQRRSTFHATMVFRSLGVIKKRVRENVSLYVLT